MTNDFFAPVDSVSVADRAAAQQRLREAHQQGRMDAREFEARVSAVITADRLDELSAAEHGPLPTPQGRPAAAPYAGPAHATYAGYAEPTPAPVARATGASRPSSTMAVIAHLSPFVLWLFGPAIIWAISPRDSYARREAAKAFNWQLLAFVVGIVVGALGGLLPGDGNPLAGIWTAIWVVFTVIGAVGAAKFRDWTNPIRALAPWEVLPERRG